MILYREWLGLVLVAGYLFVLPAVMAMTIFRNFFMRMGFMRYMVFSNLVLFMACLPMDDPANDAQREFAVKTLVKMLRKAKPSK